MARRRIVALAFAVHGIGMLVAPDAYTSPTYTVITAVAPLRWWGTAWCLVAVAAAVTAVPRMLAVGLIAGHVTTWAAGLAAAVATGDATTPTAPVPWALVAALVVHSASRPVDG